jgi:hypothetical protein
LTVCRQTVEVVREAPEKPASKTCAAVGFRQQRNVPQALLARARFSAKDFAAMMSGAKIAVTKVIPGMFTHEKIAGAEDGRMFKDGYDPIK